MNLKFKCKSCGGEIIVKYLKIGETAKCRNCGAFVKVPSDALNTDDQPDYVGFVSLEKIPDYRKYSDDLLPDVELIKAVIAGKTSLMVLKVIGSSLLIIYGLFMAINIHILVSKENRLNKIPAKHKSPYVHTIPYQVMILAGAWTLSRTIRVGRARKRFSDKEIELARTRLSNIIANSPDPEAGLLKANLLVRDLWSRGLISKPVSYTVRMLPKVAVFIQDDLKDYFIISKDDSSRYRFGKKGKVHIIDINKRKLTVLFDDSNRFSFWKWASFENNQHFTNPIVCPNCLKKVNANEIDLRDHKFLCPNCSIEVKL